MGKCRNTYIETIAVLCSSGENMPLGIKCAKGYIYARIFENSRLYHRIKECMHIFIYPTLNAKIFYQSLKKNLKTVYSARHQCYIIPGVPIYIEGKINRVTQHDNYEVIEITPLNETKALTLLENGYSRADGCLIELMVYYTKLQANITSKEEYCKIYETCSKSIKRSTSDELYLKMMDELKC
ncbi:MAG: DUF447 family protein [Desulfurococcales archaeon]|nr:DUF447 family protein [Desulfurococcales archaeon]